MCFYAFTVEFIFLLMIRKGWTKRLGIFRVSVYSRNIIFWLSESIIIFLHVAMKFLIKVGKIYYKFNAFSNSSIKSLIPEKSKNEKTFLLSYFSFCLHKDLKQIRGLNFMLRQKQKSSMKNGKEDFKSSWKFTWRKRMTW